MLTKDDLKQIQLLLQDNNKVLETKFATKDEFKREMKKVHKNIHSLEKKFVETTRFLDNQHLVLEKRVQNVEYTLHISS